MAEFEKHSGAVFCWPELSTTDQKGATAFYSQLLGWTVDDQPIGPTETYTLFKIRGKDVAAGYTMRPEEKQAGAPPHWNSYVNVPDADAAAKRAQELGGTVLVPPFDVMEHGRMAVLQDPGGAVFQVWQAKKHIGARILNEPGALCWTELTTRNPAAAEKFYTQLFGWTAKHSADGPIPYTEFSVGGVPGIGMLPMPTEMPAAVPSFWMPYFQVANVDQSVAKAKQLGAKLMKQMDIPHGRFAIFGDPQNAMFALYESKV